MLSRFLWDGISRSNFGGVSPDDLKRLQEKRLRRSIMHAYGGSKFWHEWFDRAGVKPDEISSAEDLRKLPLCTRSELALRPFEERRIGNPKSFVRAPTSGTTGFLMPGCWSGAFNDYWASVVYFRMRALGGIGLFDKVLCLTYTTPRKTGETRAAASWLPVIRRKAVLGLLEPILSKVGEGVYRRLYFSNGIEEILPEIIRANPALVWGVTSQVRLLADAASAGKAPGLHPKAVICGGDCLDDASRAYFESTFGCPALGMYAANEVGFIAMECREKVGMHVMADSMIIEVLRDGEPVAPGELGELVVTTLLNDAMPLIRYNLADVVKTTDEACPCGRMTPLLKSVEGRTEDLLILDGKRMVSSRDIASILNSDPTLACQITQEEVGRFKLRFFALDEPPAREQASALVGRLRRVLGEEASIEVAMEVPRADKRKLRVTTSVLKPSLNAVY